MTVSTSASAPVLAAVRLRKGSANSAKGAARLVADALITAKAAGATGVRILRADPAYYGHDVIAAAAAVTTRHGSPPWTPGSATQRRGQVPEAHGATVTADVASAALGRAKWQLA